MSRIGVWAKTAAAALGAGGLVVVAFAAFFAAGELREGIRAACAAPTAGWLTRQVCNALGVERPIPTRPIELPDAPAAEKVDRQVIPDCQPGQGLERLLPSSSDLVEWELTFGRDLDGDGRVGTVAPRATRSASATGSVAAAPGSAPGAVTVAGSPGAPAAALTGDQVAAIDRLIFGRKKSPPAPRGGEILATTAAGGGPLVLDFVATPVPRREWLHELELAVEADLPVAGRPFADSAEVSAGWTFARWRSVYFGLRGYGERLPKDMREALGRELDWGVRARLSLRCHGLGDCEPR